VYLHAAAGDKLVREIGPEALTASKVLREMGPVLRATLASDNEWGTARLKDATG